VRSDADMKNNKHISDKEMKNRQ